LINAGVLPKSVSSGADEDLIDPGKLAMMISGPWAWSNLMKCGIDFGVAPSGVDKNVGRPFVGVTLAYPLKRSKIWPDFLGVTRLPKRGSTLCITQSRSACQR
jgi:maltose-binding protein MalE